ncbi:hypothetical protein OK016_30145 [Vibrio chagasii]|nr:hypothetical protein [Vibrio chagasii]
MCSIHSSNSIMAILIGGKGMILRDVLGAILFKTPTGRTQRKHPHLGEKCNPRSVADIELDELAQRFVPVQYNQKAIKLKAVTEWFCGQFSLRYVCGS